jgi:acyl-CoA thioesterase I
VHDVSLPAFAVRRRTTRLLRLVCFLLPVAFGPVFAAEAARAAAPLKLLALGDSLTAGYGLSHEDGFAARLQHAIDAEGLDAHVLDAGVSGDTSAGALARLDWALGDDTGSGPDAAIVELGGNDALRGLPPAQMEQNLSAILDKLQARHIPVLLSGMFAPPNMGAAYGAEFHAVFDRLSRRPGLIFDPFFLQGVATHEPLEQADHIHPNEAGVRIIVARLMPAVRQLLSRARAQARGQGHGQEKPETAP